MARNYLVTIRGKTRIWPVVAELDTALLADPGDTIADIVELVANYCPTVRDRRCWLSTQGKPDPDIRFWAPKIESEMMEADGVPLESMFLSDLEEDDDEYPRRVVAPDYSLN